MLSDSIHDSIIVLLNYVSEYNDCSNEYKKNIVQCLTILYETLYKIDSSGKKKTKAYCRQRALYEFNKAHKKLSDDNYHHCKECCCELCITMSVDTEHDHQSCEYEHCEDYIKRRKENNILTQKQKTYKIWYEKNKAEVQKKRKESKEAGIQRSIGRPTKDVKEKSIN